MPLNVALALALLTAPPGTPAEALCPLAALQSVAISLEIMDSRERRWMLADPGDLVADLRTMRERWEKLADAPPVCDADRLPNRETLHDLIMFNREWKRYLEERCYLTHEEWIADALADADALYCVYDAARDSRYEFYYVFVRRAALKKLRDKIGPHLYYAGTLPAPVPVWALRIID